MADNRSFLANQKARNAIVGAENLLNHDSLHLARKYARIFVLVLNSSALENLKSHLRKLGFTPAIT